ncbi:MAG: helix-turn-helix transcriptional regulator [Chloroflexales bacterium]|nr:helix-turn-helix transcriptional regulator [Chloroflexales bacterium]
MGFASVLTPREREVLELAVQGLGDKAIADKLIISVRTVQCHLYRCYQKLGVSGRTAAMRLVLQERE